MSIPLGAHAKRPSIERASSAVVFSLTSCCAENYIFQTQLIDSFPLIYGMWSSDLGKLSIPLEAHHKAQSSEFFLSLEVKIQKSCNFLYYGQFCWNCIFKHPRWRAFKRRMACQIPAKKSCSSHLFGVVPSRAAQTAFVLELSKTITSLSYVVSGSYFTFKLG